jgi:hydroxyacylglutathione hydrolase
MRLFYHFSVDNFSNTYLLGPREGGDALIIDPGIFDETLLNMIEDNNYDLKYILVTRASNAHLRGLSTIKKIYDAQIYAGIPQIKSFNINVLQPDSTIELGELQVEVLPFKELSQDSLIYKIGRWVFCSDVLSAGKACREKNPYTVANVKEAVEKRLLTLPEDTILFPGEGPPTSVRSERRYNEGLGQEDRPGAPGP